MRLRLRPKYKIRFKLKDLGHGIYCWTIKHKVSDENYFVLSYRFNDQRIGFLVVSSKCTILCKYKNIFINVEDNTESV